MPVVEVPWKPLSASFSTASGWFWSPVIVSEPCAKAQPRLLNSSPGQPPSGRMVPWSLCPGACAKVMLQDGAFGAASIQRPAMEAAASGAAFGSPAQAASISAIRMPLRRAVPSASLTSWSG
jgi:hypothetical protein